MRIAAIADIHGNLPALEAVCADMPAVEATLCAGDVVGYNPWPAECVSAMRERAIPTISGNHDRAVTRETDFRFNPQAQAGVEFARRELDDEQLAWLRNLPQERRYADGRVRIVHGHPADPDRYTFPGDFSGDLLGEERVLVMGHTHVQHVESYEAGTAVNPGSVGQPRDGDPRAAYAIIDLETGAVETRRVAYDVDRVQDAIAEARLPTSLGERLAVGR